MVNGYFFPFEKLYVDDRKIQITHPSLLSSAVSPHLKSIKTRSIPFDFARRRSLFFFGRVFEYILTLMNDNLGVNGLNIIKVILLITHSEAPCSKNLSRSFCISRNVEERKTRMTPCSNTMGFIGVFVLYFCGGGLQRLVFKL